ncbi:MBL fold metallo-hydrolase [Erwinia sp. OLTSP20]|uniref:MBL fold metallo-hydrolase n=1 Tax=unclassified Erwinia TaxID=2622719 RepID=UPI000C180C0B|nr:MULTISPECIES: MBL fold metallo-hydrolase [unclassified Erwinia]PIJ50329.1 MBL fold metallo-hydrolase [Erwinia sp. OAMSP11]PIJ72166.1 MBL fold metallo-hydrolase [Erwinia sp. OLSSP12]PIJ81457.1 MBL fold metallo-hydrolase [Erwinia sp. OLCASP19]PIJ84163.1 MBL fold metallo-hydrolase [Erwinia sp. OLMTSP26]PIJ85862.1 MBL fold metallo-hydrolase [Erwinia sp. OLMDSP33]
MTKTDHFRVGECEIFKVLEQEIPLPATMLFPDQLTDHFQPSTLQLSVHSWVVKTPDALIVIDTASGNQRERPASPMFHQLNTDYAQRLNNILGDRRQVNWVLMTHLHGDHVGWNTHRVNDQWQPMFPHARYICSDAELTRWQQDPSRAAMVADSLTPVINAGLLHTISPHERPQFAGVLHYEPTPGHSYDHASIILHSAGEYALFSGDLMHNEIQVSQPGLASRFCEHRQQAESQRRRMLDWAADRHALWFSSHFAGRSAGYIQRQKQGFRWQAV